MGESAFTARQSILSTFARCPLSARFELDNPDYRNPALNRGSLAHRVAEEILRTLRRTANKSMGQEDGLTIMREVLGQVDTPSGEVLTLGPDEMLNLRQFVIRFCSDYEWTPARFLAIEDRLYADIVCPDGVTRTVTGAPDLLIAEPATKTVVIKDFKSGWGPAKEPRSDDPSEPKRYLTARGHFQLDTYGLLVLRRYPNIPQVRFEEDHPRTGDSRPGTLTRDELGNVENELGVLLMLLHRAESEGPSSEIWRPVPDLKSCAWCRGRALCPVATMERGMGTLTPENRGEHAARVIAQDALRDQDLAVLKAEVDANGPIDLGNGMQLGWEQGARSRRFKPHHPQDAAESQAVRV